MTDIIERLDELAAYFEDAAKEPSIFAPVNASNGMLIRDAIKAISAARSAESDISEALLAFVTYYSGHVNNPEIVARVEYASAVLQKAGWKPWPEMNAWVHET